MEPERIADVARMSYVGSDPACRKSDDWFTPTPYIESARLALGTISLDPFSSEEANRIVGAERFHTESDDAFAQPWEAATVWMNPPYSGKLVAAAMNRLIDEYLDGNVGAAIVLINNATETRWFQRSMTVATAMCLTDHRIAFWNTDGKRISNNTRGQAFLLFGPGYGRPFKKHFDQHGKVVWL